MKISLNWLKQYIDTDLSPNEIGEILTQTGLEVESIEKVETIKGGLQGVVVGEVVEKTKHPEADRLSVTKVDIGTNDVLQIVCGAPNVEVGQKVLVATVGSTIYPNPDEPLKIKKSKIRGVESQGMICAEDELGVGEDHNGIMVLPSETKIGTAAKDFFNIEDDFLFEIGLTPNRSDAMGHIGVARDLKAYLNFHHKKSIALKIPEIKHNTSLTKNPSVSITVEEQNACPRYMGAVIKNITVSESPSWLQNKLRTIGLKPINVIVDITNYVMFETGNPLHAFDLNKTGNKIVVRKTKNNEKITTLDGSEKALQSSDLLICNETTPMCIAGVLGGLDSGINTNTKAVFLEAACFEASTIRRTAKSLGLSTDSSFRFERGVDINGLPLAIGRAIDLIITLTGGELIELQDVYPSKQQRNEINFNFEKCRKHCGAHFSNKEIKHILNELEINIIQEENDTALLAIPTYRIDVTRAEDVYEEVLRIYGFNAVPIPTQLKSSINYRSFPDQNKYYNLIADLLSNNGFFEILNNSLTSSLIYERINSTKYSIENAVRLLNPLSNELDIMRQNLIGGGMAVIEFNQNRQRPDLKLYEFGKVYFKTEKGYLEKNKLAIFITGNKSAENWNHTRSTTNFYTIKGIIEKLFLCLGLNDKITTQAINNDLYEDGYSLSINELHIGDYGWVTTEFKKQFGIKNDVYCAELDWDILLKFASNNKTSFVPISKTQFVRRDYSLLLNEEVKFDQIEKIAVKSERNLLKKVGLFDVYEGKNLEKGKKSYAVSFYFQHPEKTLQDKQIDNIMQIIRTNLEKELGAELR